MGQMREDNITYYQLKQMKTKMSEDDRTQLWRSLLGKQKEQNYYYGSINQDKPMQCPICCQFKPEVYSIANCPHRFCLDCCMTHICTKAELFTDILCPDNNCKLPLDKKSTIINRLPAKTLQHMRKRERFNYLAAHPELKSCSVVNCPGVINIKHSKKVCDTCFQPHCPKCYKTFHIGACVIDDHDRQMKANNFQKCPNCSIWVEKQQGCNFIDCKCGVTFCYACGVPFAEDPCRLNQIWGQQIEIRKTFLNIKYKFPQSKYKYPLLALKIPLQIIVFLLWTIMFSLISTSLIAILIGLLIALSPILIIALSCTAQKRIAVLIVILLLPILTSLGIILILLVFSLYPFLRRINHHGIYDGFDMAVYAATKCYLRTLVSIFN